MENERTHSLHILFWEATLRCNAYCEFCGSRCGGPGTDAMAADEVEGETVCACLQDISEIMDPCHIMINVTGGEPLLRKDLFAVMTYASALGFPWGMVTNGSLIDEDTVEKMRLSGMKTISVSLDGLPWTHNALRRIPDGCQRAERAVALLKKADFLDELQITTVVNHKNIEELEAMLPRLQAMGVDSWRLAIIDPIGRAAGNPELLFTADDYEKYFSFFERHQFNGIVALTTSCSHFWGTRDNLYRPHSFACQAGRHVASILANGDIYVCPNVKRIPELMQGNIRTDSFCERWNNGFTWFRREDRQNSDRCTDCSYWDQCKGDSLHTWDFEAKAPNCCYVERINTESFYSNSEKRVKEALRKYYPELKGIIFSYDSSSNRKIIFTPCASREFFSFFSWGNTGPRNVFELLCGLAGYRYDHLFIVESIIPGRLENRSETSAAFSESNYQELVTELHTINQCLAQTEDKYRLWGTEYHLLGIAHSHPVGLKPTMSVPDMQLHEKMQLRHAEFISLIINPQQKCLCAFLDSLYSPTDVEFLVSNEHELREVPLEIRHG